ncbi:MAG: hypothetical protein ACJAYH_001106 [Celeribacter sp.]
MTVYDTYEGTDGPEKLTSNTIHPFFVVLDETTPRLVAQSAEGHIYEGPIKGGAWVDAVHLRPGHSLRTPDGTLRKVLTVNITAEPLTAYNLTVDQAETYFVGEEPVWVHNACDVSKRIARQQAAQRGRDAEQRVLNDMGMEKNTQKFEGPEGNTIPDAIDDTKLVEIKDAKRVTDSKQARNQHAVAKERGVESVLVTGTNTRVSPKAEDRYGRVDRRDDLGPDE